MEDKDRLDQIGRAAMQAWGRMKKAQAKMWGEWMTIGEGLLEGRRWAMHMAGVNTPEGRGYVTAFAEWLKRYRLDDMDKSDRAKLLQLMEERPGVEEWRATLTDYERRNLNNPVMVWRRWTAATRVKKPKPRSAGVSATEHGRARHTIEQLQARVEELEQELNAATSSDHLSASVPVDSLLAAIREISKDNSDGNDVPVEHLLASACTVLAIVSSSTVDSWPRHVSRRTRDSVAKKVEKLRDDVFALVSRLELESSEDDDEEPER